MIGEYLIASSKRAANYRLTFCNKGSGAHLCALVCARMSMLNVRTSGGHPAALMSARSCPAASARPACAYLRHSPTFPSATMRKF